MEPLRAASLYQCLRLANYHGLGRGDTPCRFTVFRTLQAPSQPPICPRIEASVYEAILDTPSWLVKSSRVLTNGQFRPQLWMACRTAQRPQPSLRGR